MGFGGRFVVSTMLSCLRLFNNSLHHSFGGPDERARKCATTFFFILFFFFTIFFLDLVFPFEVLPDNLSAAKVGVEVECSNFFSRSLLLFLLF